MAHVMVIGAGLAGCTAAARLAQAGIAVALVEKDGAVGGRVRHYGCKATDRCNNCGVCLTGDLWKTVERHPLIEVVPFSRVTQLSGTAGDYTAVASGPQGARVFSGLSDIVVATGFESVPNSASAHLQIEGKSGIMTGTQLEQVMLQRTATGVLPKAPKSVAFIQCFGSRDAQERAMYCSRVCCGYSTRAAKVLRQYYPECEIAFFYMELQAVANCDYYKELTGLGVEFIKCRPLDITGGKPAVIRYDDPAKGMTQRSFDLVVLSEGIHPAAASADIAEMLGLQQDADGFLHPVAGSAGLHVAGCARTPLKIEESYADAVAVADAIVADTYGCAGVSV